MSRVKLIYEPGETGWAEEMSPPGRARLINLPIAEEWNVLDVVDTEPTPGGKLRKCARLVERVYPNKTAIEYGARQDFRPLYDLFLSRDCKCEGLMSGLMLVAHHGLDLIEVASSVGLFCQLSKTQPRLHMRH